MLSIEMVKKTKAEEYPSAQLTNFYDVIDEKYKPKHKQKHFLGPVHPFRMVIAGPSGGGKTNIVMNIITKLVHYDKLYLYCKKLDEPLYKWIIEEHKKIEEECIKDMRLKLVKQGRSLDSGMIEKLQSDCKIIEYSSLLADVISPDKLDEEKQHLIIVDDMVTENAKSQKVIEELYIHGRKNNASIIYLSQNYQETPKNIRKNANYVGLIKIDNKREITELQKEHASRVSKEEFVAAYKNVHFRIFLR